MHSSQRSFYYTILAYVFLVLAVVMLLTSAISVSVQKNTRHHPIKLLQHRSYISRFFHSLSPMQQKRYCVLGVISGMFSGICFGAATYKNRPKNPK